MARWGLLGTVVGLALCVGFPTVAFADEAPPATASPPPAEPGEAPAQPAYPPPVSPAAAPPAADPPPAYPPAGPATPAVRPTLQVRDSERARAPVPRQRRKIGLMIAGLAMFGAGYVGSVVSLAASSTLYGEAGAFGPQMMIPIAGPWLQLSSTDWDAVSEQQRASAQFTLALQGVLQGVGALLATIGISQYAASKAPERTLSFQLGPTNGGAFGTLRAAF